MQNINKIQKTGTKKMCKCFKWMTKRRVVNLSGVIIGVCMLFTMLFYNCFDIETDVYADEPVYMIKINRMEHCLTIYKKDASGQYTNAIRNMTCATGVVDDATPIGVYKISKIEQWSVINGTFFAQYSINLDNGLKIRTALYSARKKDALVVNEYNRIGENGTDGAIVLNYADTKWISENCGIGTVVEVFEEKGNLGGMDRADTIKVPEDDPYSVWDPTDDDASNPWKTKQPTISGAKGIITKEGEKIDLLKGVKAYDVCGNDITKDIIIMGDYDLERHGKYSITYMVEDLTGAVVTKDINVTVNPGGDTKETTKKNDDKQETISGGQSTANPSDANGESDAQNQKNKNEKSFRDKMIALIVIGIAAMGISFVIFRHAMRN